MTRAIRWLARWLSRRGPGRIDPRDVDAWLRDVRRLEWEAIRLWWIALRRWWNSRGRVRRVTRTSGPHDPPDLAA